MARYPAGQNIEVVVEMAGRPHGMWWYVAGGAVHPENALKVKDWAYIRRTPNLPASDPHGRDYGPLGNLGDMSAPYPRFDTIDTDRPGPITTADDVVVARFIVDAKVPFTVFAA